MTAPPLPGTREPATLQPASADPGHTMVIPPTQCLPPQARAAPGRGSRSPVAPCRRRGPRSPGRRRCKGLLCIPWRNRRPPEYRRVRSWASPEPQSCPVHPGRPVGTTAPRPPPPGAAVPCAAPRIPPPGTGTRRLQWWGRLPANRARVRYHPRLRRALWLPRPICRLSPRGMSTPAPPPHGARTGLRRGRADRRRPGAIRLVPLTQRVARRKLRPAACEPWAHRCRKAAAWWLPPTKLRASDARGQRCPRR